MTRVFIVEDHAFTRDGLRVAVGREPDLKVVGEARSAEEAIEQLERTPADVVLMDIGLPGMDGIEATRRVKERFGVRVVVLTVHQLEAEVLAAMTAGADAYCLKSTDPASLLLAIRAAAIGSTYLDPQIAHIVLGQLSVPSEGQAQLSPRELEVLRLIADGLSNKEIAQALGLSLSTVKTYIEDLLAKLSASDRTQAAIKALRQGLL
ncbi:MULTISPECIES: response regulator transcription factor [unclassified Meiothermus]|uniref:response regulator n=1 Tax=unclassified Meiothermus TaxID=370471 RepID=UPI000D7CF0CE|nr:MULTISPECIES: response regulator transcription factor [unclassified Meiothermus]PZA06920.1 DNA-binding response regulator [Meiothermus sp. Pnk-1]RYM38315.1 response regulator transcription factor [Meiothermus sp. PNK-Is4]